MSLVGREGDSWVCCLALFSSGTSFAEAAQFSREFLRAASVEYPSVPLDELSAFALACWEHKRDNTEASDSATLRLSIEGRKSSTSPPP